jgi:hypothetical protein
VDCDINNQEKQTKENIKEFREIKMHRALSNLHANPAMLLKSLDGRAAADEEIRVTTDRRC